MLGVDGLLAAFPLVAVFIALLSAVVNVLFATNVLLDGRQRQATRVGTDLVSPGIWALATLFGGVFVAAVYWLIHYSTLRPEDERL